MKYLIPLITAIYIISSAAAAHCRVNVIGTWGGSELESFLKVCEAGSLEVNFETTRDLDAILEARAGGGNLPDAAIIPNPSKMKDLAMKGVIKPMDFLDRKALEERYSKKWTDMGCYGGKLYCVFYKVTNKSLVWYDPKRFSKSGLAVPETWDDMIALTDKIRSGGAAPWSIGADIGWPLTDWIENIMAKKYGSEFYQSWAGHEVPWTHEKVKGAFLEWGRIIGDGKNLCGGKGACLAENFQKAAYKVFQEPPQAAMYCGPDFMGSIISSGVGGLEPGVNVSFFAFPPRSKDGAGPIVVGADALVIFKPGAETEKLARYLTSDKAHRIWAGRGGFISHDRSVGPDAYPDELSKKAAGLLTGSNDIVFDASDIMPPAVGNRGGFWDACKQFVQDPGRLDKILEEMEELALKHY